MAFILKVAHPEGGKSLAHRRCNACHYIVGIRKLRDRFMGIATYGKNNQTSLQRALNAKTDA
ncbi:MAG: hypothetical protein ACAF41_20530 [Leptolyngbya sp. BL-A-14]